MERFFFIPEINFFTKKFDITATIKGQIQSIYPTNLCPKDKLINPYTETAKEFATALLHAMHGVDMTEVKAEAHMEWMKDLNVLVKSAEYISTVSEVEKIRMALSPLSDQLYQTISKFEVETGGYRQFCPMAFNNEGAFWLSNSDEILNPYFGDLMLTCGSVEEELK